jgi:hypothetical protein
MIEDEQELDFILNLHNVRGVLIEDVMESLLKFYPEFHINTAVERIKEFIQ